MATTYYPQTASTLCTSALRRSTTRKIAQKRRLQTFFFLFAAFVVGWNCTACQTAAQSTTTQSTATQSTTTASPQQQSSPQSTQQVPNAVRKPQATQRANNNPTTSTTPASSASPSSPSSSSWLKQVQSPATEEITLSAKIHEPTPFQKHTGAGEFDNYLAMNLPFAPIEAVRVELEKRLGVTLKHRGEAHITIVTPTEYAKALRKNLSMQEINGIAEAMNLQQMQFVPLCVGRAQAGLDGAQEQTYYVVVASNELLALRRAIFRKYVEKGGEPSLFDPNHFYPHITIGFTRQDLHEETNGVRKGENSCYAPVRER